MSGLNSQEAVNWLRDTTEFWPSELLFKFGDKVARMNKSYRYPGIIRGWSLTTNGDKRYVVEAVGEGYEGMLHIFSEEELEYV